MNRKIKYTWSYSALLLYILWTSSIGLAFSQECSDGWFGDGCVYKCRCNISCESDGSCSPGSRCQPRWFGPACQYVDLAPLGYTKNPIVDGNDDSCNTDTTLHNVTLSWDQSYLITWLRLHAMDATDSLHSVNVQFSEGSGKMIVNVSCVKSPNTISQTLDIFCNVKVPVNRVTLTGEIVKSLCSVYVSGGRNVALKQETFQSGNTTESGTTYWSGLAVDGNTDQDFYQGSCTATNEEIQPSYWIVNLSHPVTVSRFVLYNRDSVIYRLEGFHLTAFDVNNVQVYSYTDADTVQYVYTLFPNTSVLAVSSVKIIGGRFADILSLCEFELYGDTQCEAGRYGRECDHTCNCADTSESCFVSTGGCPSGCADGYIGEACTPCPSGTFGKDCVQNCSEQCMHQDSREKQACNHVNGTCEEGCLPGYITPFCNHSCPSGTFGTDCSSICSQFCMNQDNNGIPICDKSNGTCKGGCLDGYIPPLCNDSCKPGTYGPNCNLTCSESCINSTNDERPCDHINGTCLNGCENGYYGSTCMLSCTVNTYGQGCSFKCSEFCISLNGSSESLCDRMNGACLLGCKNGYENPKCTEVCKPGKYGPQCSLTCSEFCFNNTDDERSCDHVNGACLHGCMNGYEGSTCMSSCSPGTYGNSCNSTCDQNCVAADSFQESSCHHISGNCLYGCLAGYSGSKCSEGSTEQPSSEDAGLIAGICVITVVAAVISAVIVIYYRRRIRTTTGRERLYDVPSNRGQNDHEDDVVSGGGYQGLGESSLVTENTSNKETDIGCEDPEVLQMTHLQSGKTKEKHSTDNEEADGDGGT